MQKHFNLKLLSVMLMLLMISIGLNGQLSRKPDLTVVKITVDRDCHLVALVRNNGPGYLPNSVYTNHHPKSAGVYVYINGKGWGGQSIWKFDPGRKLQKPGGQAAYISSYKVGAPIDVKAVVDLHDVVKEANERNNTSIRKGLTCGDTGPVRKIPDLTVSDIQLVKGCQIAVTVKNIGTAGVPESYYDLPDAVAVQMYNGNKPWGGMILKMFDPAGNLKSPGGTATHIWFPNAANLKLGPGTHSIKVIVDFHKVLTELSETNNTLTKRLTCKKATSAIATTAIGRPQLAQAAICKTPTKFFLDFNDAYLVFSNPHKSIQISTQGNVLSYGSDWEKCQLKPYLYHIRQKFWKSFFWKVNTSRKEVYEITGGTFCKISPGASKTLPIQVDVVGGSTTTPPDRFFLRFKEAHLIYLISSKTMQLITGDKVLSYCQDWKKCALSGCVYHFKENFWTDGGGFHWEINTTVKKAVRIKGGTFCASGGSKEPLGIGVRVIY